MDRATHASRHGSRPRPADAAFRRLGDAEWLDGAFSAGDLMMASVLLRLRASGILDEFTNLAAYVAAEKHAPPMSELSQLNWRSTPGRHRPADRGPSWARRITLGRSSLARAAPDFFQDPGAVRRSRTGRWEFGLDPESGSEFVTVGSASAKPQIAISGRVMVRSQFVAGRHFSEGYAFLCLTQIAFPFTHRVHACLQP